MMRTRLRGPGLPFSRPALIGLAAACALTLGAANATVTEAGRAASGPAPAPATLTHKSSGIQGARNPAPRGRTWSSLSGAQKKALAPLASQWNQMEPASQEKWLQVAARYPSLPPDAQARMQQRMGQWSVLAPAQRGDARVRFQATRELSANERQQRWDAYQALPPEQKQQLADQARQRQQASRAPDAAGSPAPAASGLGKSARSSGDTKANVVPDLKRQLPPTQAIAPGVVKAGPGATTNLVTQKAAPPMHQQTGLPKIAATDEFVDPKTLLPRKGSQGAGMTPPAPASTPTP